MDRTFQALSDLSRAENEFPGISQHAISPKDVVAKKAFDVVLLNCSTDSTRFLSHHKLCPDTPFVNYLLLDAQCNLIAPVAGYTLQKVLRGFWKLKWTQERWVWHGPKQQTVGDAIGLLDEPDTVRHIVSQSIQTYAEPLTEGAIYYIHPRMTVHSIPAHQTLTEAMDQQNRTVPRAA